MRHLEVGRVDRQAVDPEQIEVERARRVAGAPDPAVGPLDVEQDAQQFRGIERRREEHGAVQVGRLGRARPDRGLTGRPEPGLGLAEGRRPHDPDARDPTERRHRRPQRALAIAEVRAQPDDDEPGRRRFRAVPGVIESVRAGLFALRVAPRRHHPGHGDRGAAGGKAGSARGRGVRQTVIRSLNETRCGGARA